MRNSIVFMVSLLVLIPLLNACKKVIKLELNTATPQIVIEGNIYDQPGPYVVKIFKSVNFDQPSIYPPVTGATVIIRDSSGHSDQLTESQPGSYLTSSLAGVPGETYSLSVTTADGQSFTASSKMPDPVSIGKIYFQNSLIGHNIYPGITFADPPIISNYYRLILLLNNVLQPDINVTDDRLSEGKTITYLIRLRDTDIKLYSGDLVTIWLESVDKGVYEYFRTAGREGGQSASPANPTSNISHGALGYFNACSVKTLSSKVP